MPLYFPLGYPVLVETGSAAVACAAAESWEPWSPLFDGPPVAIAVDVSESGTMAQAPRFVAGPDGLEVPFGRIQPRRVRLQGAQRPARGEPRHAPQNFMVPLSLSRCARPHGARQHRVHAHSRGLHRVARPRDSVVWRFGGGQEFTGLCVRAARVDVRFRRCGPRGS